MKALDCGERVRVLKQKEPESRRDATYAGRRLIYQEAMDETEGLPQPRRTAAAYARFLREKEIVVFREELLAGHIQFCDYALSRPSDVAQEVEEALGDPSATPREAAALREFLKGVEAGLFCRSCGGHVVAGYDRVLRYGLGELRNRARAAAEEKSGDRRAFALAAEAALDAASDYIRRYAAQAGRLSEREGATEYGASLKRICEAGNWIAANPPRSFFEALQLTWFTHELIVLEQLSGSFSLGRFDQYLYPYYETDIAAGALTREEAYQLICAFWIKLSGLRKGFQNVTIGGCDAKGRAAYNELTQMALWASGEMRTDQPLLSLRCMEGMPDEIAREAMRLIEKGMGFPALFGDSVCIKAKQRMGATLQDARNYAIIGCVEPTIPGKERSDTEGLRVNWAKVLELMFSGGTCRVTGHHFAMKSAEALQETGGYDAFFDRYLGELKGFTELGAEAYNALDRRFSSRWPSPFLSSTMQGCLEAGKDIAQGATPFLGAPLNACGMASTVDSLCAVRKLVFEEGRLSLARFAEILKDDFAGQDELLTDIRRCPAFGRDDPRADACMAVLTDFFCDLSDQMKNPYGGPFLVGMYSVEWHALLGKKTGALPCGRRAGVSLSNGLSASQGADSAGPTAAILSETAPDHTRFGNGMVFDLKFHPAFFDGARHREAFLKLVETYFRLGGMEMQINVADAALLRRAQSDPKSYGNLIVRVSGFSAYFVDLDRTLQDEIIARTEHMAL